jgi:hypothetical protein
MGRHLVLCVSQSRPLGILRTPERSVVSLKFVSVLGKGAIQNEGGSGRVQKIIRYRYLSRQGFRHDGSGALIGRDFL